MPMATEAPPQPRRSARLRAARELLLLDNDEPATYAEAMADPDSEKAICHEIRNRIHEGKSSLELDRPA